MENFWEPDGTLRWQCERYLQTHIGIWTHFWQNGNKKIVSEWNLNPIPRDLIRSFIGCVANGISSHYSSNGTLIAIYNFVNGLLQNK